MEQTVRDFTPKASAVPLRHFWAVLERSLAGQAFCFLSLVFYMSCIDHKGLGPSLGLGCAGQVWPQEKGWWGVQECDSGKWGLLEARLPRNWLEPALLKGDADSFSQQMSSTPLLLSLAMQECHGSRTGVYSGEWEREKAPPRLSGCWQASLVWQGTADFAPHLYSLRLERGKRGWLPAEDCLLLVSFSYLVPAKMSFLRVMGDQWGPCPLLLCCSGAVASHPSIWCFLISEKQVGQELGTSRALCQRAS